MQGAAFALAAAWVATTSVALGMASSASAQEAQEAQAEKSDRAAKVADVQLDDVWPSPDGPAGPPLIELYVRALDRDDEPVADLTAADFRITDGGAPVAPSAIREITNLEMLGRGVACVVAIDTSAAMTGDPLKRARAAVSQFVENVREPSRVAVVAFSDEVRTIAPFEGVGSGDSAVVGVRALQVNPDAAHGALYDGLQRAIELIRTTTGLPRRAFVIVFSEGLDTGSQTTLEQLLAYAKGSDARVPVMVDAVGYGSGGQGLEILNRIAEETGGISLRAVSTIHIAPLFRVIWHRMRDGYILRYAADLDGGVHEIEVAIGQARNARAALLPEVQPEPEPIAREIPIAAAAAALAGVTGTGLAVWLLRRKRPAGRLRFESPLPAGDVFELRKSLTTIGFLDENDIEIPRDTVSKRHVRIHRRGRKLEIEDLDSLNGTFVNDSRISTSALEAGDRIRIADVEAVFER